MQPQTPKLAFTIVQVAELCSVGTDTVRRLIDEGVFAARRLGTAKNSKIVVTARSVHAWLEGVSPDRDREPEIAPRIAEAAPIPLASLPYMDADERREIEKRWKSGELTPSTISGKPVLIVAPTGAQR